MTIYILNHLQEATNPWLPSRKFVGGAAVRRRPVGQVGLFGDRSTGFVRACNCRSAIFREATTGSHTLTDDCLRGLRPRNLEIESYWQQPLVRFSVYCYMKDAYDQARPIGPRPTICLPRANFYI
nr:uncharacterized protein CTRU02_01922 [Colletotrichum truncatum]KAF6799051.1 hypothetical protein CTRU02_01922 [Colletotrichum truncatum]